MINRVVDVSSQPTLQFFIFNFSIIMIFLEISLCFITSVYDEQGCFIYISLDLGGLSSMYSFGWKDGCSIYMFFQVFFFCLKTVCSAATVVVYGAEVENFNSLFIIWGFTGKTFSGYVHTLSLYINIRSLVIMKYLPKPIDMDCI
ncbi:uncharacterized protein LOC123918878 isoform X2 [Trifolium pratense]|uniref:uncharacterized protein LOC123918878 isoform X2 n=1 Tax=Trifolium pratense TaxID=57577 RepID=UPI001E695F31|nr:uncharacterized protein LOC123918878 isoform X2 [Trifolium pratense]